MPDHFLEEVLDMGASEDGLRGNPNTSEVISLAIARANGGMYGIHHEEQWQEATNDSVLASQREYFLAVF
jgi:hypothetical protein